MESEVLDQARETVDRCGDQIAKLHEAKERAGSYAAQAALRVPELYDRLGELLVKITLKEFTDKNVILKELAETRMEIRGLELAVEDLPIFTTALKHRFQKPENEKREAERLLNSEGTLS